MKDSFNIDYEEKIIEVPKKYVNIQVNDQLIETIDLNAIIKKKNIKISDNEYKEKNKIVDIIEIGNKKIYIYLSKKGNLFVTNNINEFYKVKQKINCKITKKYLYFYGTITNINHKVKNFDKVFLNGKKVANIKRISNMKKLKDFAIFRIPISKIEVASDIHNPIRIGVSENLSVPLQKKRKSKGMNYFAKKQLGENYILVRSIINGNKIMITKVKMEEEYKKINLFKNYVARKIYRIIPGKQSILMFEKESNKANESGYYMFKKIMAEKNKRKIKSNVYFIINKDSLDYKKVKERFGKNVIEKYSFKHYLQIYKSKYFISSELSNHVINPRLYIKSINDTISKKPLIFLQHGIMFAKPVDNPAAKGFYKSNPQIKIYKSVISSDLEATQFYRMGYNKNDLIKCGLTKFDTSYINEDADKIMYMPTYRYWEEVQICNEDTIKETTYYKTYMKVIKKFEEAGLIDRLIVSCHPKFAECLTKAAPEYASIIENDINRGIENSKIFITDYSSAAYDAHYRGAYIIYNWEERDYLIENYKAIPPVDETNCDGVPVFNVDDLIKEVKIAIDKNYIMDEMYQERYKKINEFSDGKNGDRLIEELKKLEIL